MPATAAVPEAIQESELRMDIDEIVSKTLSDLRFVTALNCEILKEG
jgi:hypothetical protein